MTDDLELSRDLGERAFGADVVLELFEDFLLASPRRMHSTENLQKFIDMVRKQVEKWKAE